MVANASPNPSVNTVERHDRMTMRELTSKVVLYTLVIGLSIAFGFPFFYTITSSLKASSELYVFPPQLLPAVPQWGNYLKVFELQPFYMRWFSNTVLVTILGTAGITLSASLVAYSFARFKFRGRNLLFVLTLSTMMMPAQVTLIPQFILFSKIGWLDTLYPLWVPLWFGGGAFYIFLMRQFVMSLPKDLDEAAYIDGASRWRIWWAILFPLCKPVLATAAIIAFMAEWNRFMEPLVFLISPANYTLSVGLSFFKINADTTQAPTEHYLMAASLMMIAPTLIVFFSAQKYFVRGIVMTGLKG